MNSISWEAARRSLVDRGITDYTDGDIITEYHRLATEAERVVEQKAKQAAEEAYFKVLQQQVLENQASKPIQSSVTEGSVTEGPVVGKVSVVETKSTISEVNDKTATGEFIN